MGLVVGWQKADGKADLKLKGGWLGFVCSMCLMFHSNVSFQENKTPIWQKILVASKNLNWGLESCM